MQLLRRLYDEWQLKRANVVFYKKQLKRFDAIQLSVGEMDDEVVNKAVALAKQGWVIVCIKMPTVVNFPVHYAVEKTVLGLSDEARRITAAAVIYRDWNRRCSFDECHMGIHLSSSKVSGYLGDDLLTLLQIEKLRPAACQPSL